VLGTYSSSSSSHVVLCWSMAADVSSVGTMYGNFVRSSQNDASAFDFPIVNCQDRTCYEGINDPTAVSDTDILRLS
jgi:hypothetical protein